MDGIEFTVPPLLVLLVLSVGGALCGITLVSRGQGMLPDSFGHAILPGIVLVAYWQGVSVSPFAVLVGAIAASLTTLAAVSMLERLLELPNAVSLAATYPAMLSLGIILTQMLGLDQSGFDTHSILFGSLDFLLWPEAMGLLSFSPAKWWQAIVTAPMGLQIAVPGLLATVVWLTIGLRALRQQLFDQVHFRLMQHRRYGWALQALVLGSTLLLIIAAFLSVGAIMAVAMFAAPAVAGRLGARGLGQWFNNACLFAVGGALGSFGLIVLVPEMLLPALGLAEGPVILGLSLSGSYAVIVSAMALIRLWWSGK